MKSINEPNQNHPLVSSPPPTSLLQSLKNKAESRNVHCSISTLTHPAYSPPRAPIIVPLSPQSPPSEKTPAHTHQENEDSSQPQGPTTRARASKKNMMEGENGKRKTRKHQNPNQKPNLDIMYP
ncbi:hypothetical protein ElyMa_004445200 [Elysia marginata]|uniref:Uncharacterized protein n=1 Tax=Elysia marginata TaxID=1093978 RepID=A0AAV4HG89_9GAST|nr:hypothetical protein ElyMa_004445200 [Elysia marginata]